MKTFFNAVLMALAMTLAAQAGLAAPVRQALKQGGFYIGQVPPGTTVSFNGEAVPVSKAGGFFIGFDRHLSGTVPLKTCLPQRACTTQELRIAARPFKTQNVTGVPAKTVNPDPAALKRMAADNAAIAAARRPLTAREDFVGAFIKPAEGPFSGVFGSRRTYNGEERSWHKGLDIAAPTGTPVVAPVGGVVGLARDTFMNGNLIILDHGQRLFTAYAHLSRMDVKVGETVKKGQRIGLVGSTGRSTGPHLHWGAYWQNTAIDPMLLLIAPYEPGAKR